jgi:hypothetical protein
MQTFIPFTDHADSARVLDRQRLGKQRVETLQILKALSDPDYGWQNHPAVTMWRGHGIALIDYGLAICEEWTGRGYKDTCAEKILAMVDLLADESEALPTWWGDADVHLSHRAALARKAPDLYPAEWQSIEIPGYVWPVNSERVLSNA